MATILGDFLRKLRLSNKEILKDMATNLDVSSAFLSAVENGKKKMPTAWEEKLQKIYNLTSEQMKELKDAVMESSDIVEINLKDTSAQNKELAISFARQFDTMDEQTSKAILEFLKRKQAGEKE